MLVERSMKNEGGKATY